jgi:hypothetical protein
MKMKKAMTKSQQRLRAVGLLLMSVGLMIPILVPLFNVQRGIGLHFLEGLLLGLAIALMVGSLVVRKSKCRAEEG